MITTPLPPGLDRIEETTVKYVRQDRPITFDEFLAMFLGVKEFVELVDGCIVEKPMVQWDHEDLLLWLSHIAAMYVDERDLGVVAGTRTAVRIGPLGSRLPDFLFVRKDRRSIIHQKAIMEAPDVVIEVRSPSTTNSEVIALESDYIAIGVPEIILINPIRGTVRVNRRTGEEYHAEELASGILTIREIPGLWFDLKWLFDSPRPMLREALEQIEKGRSGQ